MPKRVEMSETEDVLSPKKRKRIQSSPSSGGKAAPPVSAKITDPYEAAVAFEEKESASRTSEEDMKLFHSTCDAIRKIMCDIEELKKVPDKNRPRIAELRALAGLHVLSLKKVNRLEKVRLKAARESTHAAKQRVDAFHLTLQNLLYEIVHVKREINRCLEFRSQDEDITLVSEEEFYRQAPETISQLAVTRDDAHRRHLARLDWELEQRRGLAADCRQLDGDKKRISQRIGEQRRRLADLAPQLATILESTRPLQQELALPLDRRRQQHRLAALLPRPLYLLYVQVAAYGEACDAAVSATICGNEEEACSLKQADQRDAVDESDSDQEAEVSRGRVASTSRSPAARGRALARCHATCSIRGWAFGHGPAGRSWHSLT
ncbi:THO complex subunit 5 homolog [Pollicipes pollicipes]|uniref:THO complex subunit 5 homolog n=1 Tax=Pollicipes pollicipes TaxID=41117 RepID=UPI00188530B4|nr:THO complex subunit 5 homolog [Pollicipes pollicipes]